MLTLDKNYLQELQEKSVKKIFIHFYEAGCSGKKLKVQEESFETQDLEVLTEVVSYLAIFVKPEEKKYFQNAMIRKVVKADHSGEEKVRFLYNSEAVKDRCGCGSSFGFEKKVPKLDLSKLKDLKKNFGK